MMSMPELKNGFQKISSVSNLSVRARVEMINNTSGNDVLFIFYRHHEESQSGVVLFWAVAVRFALMHGWRVVCVK